MKDNTSMFTQCEKCKEARNSGNFLSANTCRDCEGKGFRRTRESYICNKCGDNLCSDSCVNRNFPFGLVEANVHGGYDSKHLSDMTTYQFSMCEKCLREFFNTCKIHPKIHSCLHEDSYDEDNKNYERSVK